MPENTYDYAGDADRNSEYFQIKETLPHAF